MLTMISGLNKVYMKFVLPKTSLLDLDKSEEDFFGLTASATLKIYINQTFTKNLQTVLTCTFKIFLKR